MNGKQLLVHSTIVLIIINNLLPIVKWNTQQPRLVLGSGQLATSQLTGAQKNMQNTHWIMLTKCKPFEITEQQ